MKEFAANLVLFVILSVAFSALTGCSSSSADSNNATAGNTAATGSKSSEYPPVSSGVTNAEFELLDGTKTTLAAYKGKVVMLNLWGIWCGPCRAEMPHLVELQQKYGAQGFEVIGLNIGDHDGDPEAVDAIEQFTAQMKINYTIARMPRASTNQVYALTRQQVVPQTLLVDREGHLRGMFIGGGANVFNSMKTTVAKTMAE